MSTSWGSGDRPPHDINSSLKEVSESVHHVGIYIYQIY